MKVSKVELNDSGVQELLKSPEMQSLLSEYAQRATQSLGSGYAFDTRVGKTRANADIHATTYKTTRDAIDNGSIYKAVF